MSSLEVKLWLLNALDQRWVTAAVPSVILTPSPLTEYFIPNTLCAETRHRAAFLLRPCSLSEFRKHEASMEMLRAKDSRECEWRIVSTPEGGRDV